LEINSPIPGLDERFLRLAIGLARQARETGADPFAAVLVTGGVVVHQGTDLSVEHNDPTYHAELGVISEYCRTHRRFSLEGFALYTSTEPCAMCAGGIHWARISRVVYSVPQSVLQKLSGGRPKPGAADLLPLGSRPVEVVGPLLQGEGLVGLSGHVFVPKVQRLRAFDSDGLRGFW
jgi:tRNA(Arg) A34 adenosine deaminase TadA